MTAFETTKREGRRRRLVLLATLAGLAPLLFGCVGGASSTRTDPDFLPQFSSSSNGRAVYFAANDPRYDDKGPGSYVYPLQYENREGHFDITRFEVLDGGSNVIFVVSVRRPIPRRRPDGSTEHKGWSDHLIDIYIDKDHVPNSGNRRALPGRNVDFDAASAWETAILVTPQRSYDIERIIENRTEDLELVRIRNQILVPERAYVDGYSFRISVPKSQLGTPQPGWGYQVLLVPFDNTNLSYGNFYNGQVRRFPDDSHFGGGDDSFGDPNVIDMLASSEREQYRILGNYLSRPYAGDNRYAVVPCIYGQAGQANTEPGPALSPPAAPRKAAASAQRPAPSPPRVLPIAPAAAVNASTEATRYGLQRNPVPVASGPLGGYRLPVTPVPSRGPAAAPLDIPVPPRETSPTPSAAPAPTKSPSALETHSFDFKL